MRSLALFGVVVLGLGGVVALGCGSVKSDDGAIGANDGSDSGSATGEAGVASGNQDGGVATATNQDGSVPSVDAGPPNAMCPSQYSVYGDQDAADNLGNVNPTLIASASCTAMNEQYGDGGFSATDLTLTFTQSSTRSGMFMATLHQTTPFPFDVTVCLEPDGAGTGSKPTSPGGKDGTMILTNVPQDKPWDQYPRIIFDTNFGATPDPDFLDVVQGMNQGFGIGAVTCTFTKN